MVTCFKFIMVSALLEVISQVHQHPPSQNSQWTAITLNRSTVDSLCYITWSLSLLNSLETACGVLIKGGVPFSRVVLYNVYLCCSLVHGTMVHASPVHVHVQYMY